MVEIFGLLVCLVGSGQWRRFYEQELSLTFFIGQFVWTLLVVAVWAIIRFRFMKKPAKPIGATYFWAQLLIALATYFLIVGGYCWFFDWPVNQLSELPDTNTGNGFKILLGSLGLYVLAAVTQLRRIGKVRQG
ncbi:MAG: hypothetical protein RL683_856 [Actinomycetota bacterium]|jgi:hypothetical protein